MPGSVAEAGLCSRVLPITEIAPTLSQLFLGRRP
jgi:two-component system chemotaxis response regulator CheB